MSRARAVKFYSSTKISLLVSPVTNAYYAASVTHSNYFLYKQKYTLYPNLPFGKRK
jgi:hypothetical protein